MIASEHYGDPEHWCIYGQWVLALLTWPLLLVTWPCQTTSSSLYLPTHLFIDTVLRMLLYYYYFFSIQMQLFSLIALFLLTLFLECSYTITMMFFSIQMQYFPNCCITE